MKRENLKKVSKKLIVCLIVLAILSSYFPMLNTIVEAAVSDENDIAENNLVDINKVEENTANTSTDNSVKNTNTGTNTTADNSTKTTTNTEGADTATNTEKSNTEVNKNTDKNTEINTNANTNTSTNIEGTNSIEANAEKSNTSVNANTNVNTDANANKNTDVNTNTEETNTTVTNTEASNTTEPEKTSKPAKIQARAAAAETKVPVEIKDVALKNELLNNYDTDGDKILTESEMLQVTAVGCYGDIKDLTGLEHATNLEILSLSEKQYENMNAVYNLLNLKSLSLSGDNVKNLKNFKAVNNLESLYLSTNSNESAIDYKYIANLTSLKSLSISDYNLNTTFDIKTLSKLTNLESLALHNNQVKSLSGIENFKKLTSLDLSNNYIQDITLLKNLKNLTTLRIKTTDTKENIDTLKGLDIRDLTYYQDMEEITIGKGQKTEVELPSILQKMTDKTSPLYVDKIEMNSDLMSLNSQKTKLVLDGTNANLGTGSIYINGSYNYSNETGERNINRNISLYLNYKVHVPVEKKEEVNIPDSELKRYLLKEHDVDGDKVITNYDMLQLTSFYCYGNYSIRNLTGLEVAQNITSIYLNDSYEDISAVNKLKNLSVINISGNFKNIVSKLTIMNNIKSLDIDYYANNTQKTELDYAYLGTLKNLTSLDIRDDSRISNIDINNLKNLTNLNRLVIDTNVQLNNLEALQGLKALTSLTIHTGDKLKDISFVSKLTGLTNLDLSNNMISNIKPLRELKKLQYLYITKNPINTKESETAETLRLLQSNGTYVTVVETNKTTNIDFKDPNFKKAILSSVDLNKDNQISIDEMEQVTYLSISSSGNETISSIEEIKYAKDLYDLNLYGKIDDITPIKELKKLRNLDASADILSNNNNLKIVASLTNLDNLNISVSSNMSNLEAFGNMKNLRTLDIYNNIYVEGKQKVFDLKGIEKLTNLENLRISGSISNINLLKKLPKLQTLRVSEKLYNENGQQLTEKELIEFLKSLKIKNVQFSGYSSVDINLGIIQVGSNQKLNLANIDNELVKLAFTKGSIFYDEYPKISYYINNTDKTGNPIELDTSTIGEKYQSVYISSDKFSCSINLHWKNYVKGDTTKEINIPDANLKKIILDEHDIDGDKRITEQDMINIVWLDGYNAKIASLEGLQYAKNLKYIGLSKNYIKDITPIIGITTLESIDLANNLLTDITGLKNAKFTNLNYIRLENNFIDFKKNNANYNTLRDIMKTMQNEYSDWEAQFARIINTQYEDIKGLDNEVNLEAKLKERLTRLGIDANSDGKITRREMYYAEISDENGDGYELNLSGAKITDISGLEYLGFAYINLSNNNIKDITPLTKNKSLYSVDLSNNNITNISGINNIFNLYSVNLSGNKITDITPLTNLYNMKRKTDWRIVYIDLSKNEISNIDCVKNWKNIGTLNLSDNKITDIKALKDYNFELYENMSKEDMIMMARELTIDLSGNDIDMTKADNKKAKAKFDEMGATLKLVDKTRATEYVINKDGIYSSDSNLGTISTELSVEGKYEFVPVRDRAEYYPGNSDAKLAGVFVNTKYYAGNKEHEEQLKTSGHAIEILVTGAIKTENELNGTEYLTMYLKLPDEYVGKSALMKTENCSIIDNTRDTLQLKLILKPDEKDNKYATFIASICLKAKECTMKLSENNDEILNAIKNEQNVTIDMKENVEEIQSDIFKTLANQNNVELKVETSNAVWKFNSDDITDPNMNVNPKVTITNNKFENMDKTPFEDAIYLKFDHEGKLPGKAEIELDISNNNIYEKGKTVYLYYYNSETKEYEYIDVVSVGDNKITITLDHCSEYVISDKLLEKDKEENPKGDETPGKPADKTTTDENNNDNNNDGDNTKKNSNSNKPRTGDDSNMALWTFLTIISAVGILYITLQGKAKNKKSKHRK